MISILAFLFVLMVVVFVHEAGHFGAARLCGVRVFEFSIGFGPAIIKKKYKNTLYKISLIPFGGFVKIAGLDDDSEYDSYPKNESFLSKNVLQKFFIIVAGATMNFVFAVFVFFMVLTFVGTPSGVTNIISQVFDSTPAYEAGLQSGDIIKKVNDYDIIDMSRAVEIIHASKGAEISILIERDGEIKNYTIAGKIDEKTGKTFLGLYLASSDNIRYNPFAAFLLSGKQTLYLIKMMIVGIFELFTGNVSLDQISGPVGIAGMTSEYAKQGFASLVQFMALLSINLGLLNLLPFPALDGSRALFVLLESIGLRKIVSIDLENAIHTVGFVLLLFFLAFITFKDIFKMIGG